MVGRTGLSDLEIKDFPKLGDHLGIVSRVHLPDVRELALDGR